jgi:betaine reductase
MLENLSNKASGLVAMRHVLDKFNIKPEEIDYVIACDEEAVGDRYQRGGGNMAKAIAEHAGCINASGADVKSFCCAPGHAVQIASALVQAGLYQNVLLIGGGCVAKLGMKFAGHLANNMPILEDQMGAIGMIIGADDGQSPKIRTDAFGKHAISAGSSAQNIYQALIVKPLESIGKGIMDIDKYAVELHNPDVTEPNGNGNVPRTNYRTIAAMAVIRGEMSREEMNDFEAKHGLPGFSPTQGHIASAIPFIGHARKMIMDGEINNAMFVGKGSLFLGKMTQLSDGVSFILEKNN